MVTILRLTDKPCFLCGSHEDAVDVRFKDRTFAGVVCREHLFELLKKRSRTAPSSKSNAPAKTD